LICLLNITAFAAWTLDFQYLKGHRPAVPDSVHGFVLRQEIAHSDQVYCASSHDQAVYYGLVSLDVLVFAASNLVGFFYAKARQRKKS